MRAVFGVRQLEAAAARQQIIGQLGDAADKGSDEIAVLFDVLGSAIPQHRCRRQIRMRVGACSSPSDFCSEGLAIAGPSSSLKTCIG